MTTISIVFKVVAELSIFVFLGFLAFKWRILSRNTAIEIGNFTINITLPFLIFSSMMRRFPKVIGKTWYVLPFLDLLLTAFALIISFFIIKMIRPKEGEKEFYLISSFQNGAFFPIAVVSALFSKDMAETYYIYIFLFVLFFTPLIITFSRLLFQKKIPKAIDVLKSIFNPPFISVVFSILLVYTGLYRFIPTFFVDVSSKIGDVTIPLILFTLGGSLYYAYTTKTKPTLPYILWAILIKLVIVPISFFLILLPLNIPSYIKIVFILEAAAPTAVNSATYSMVYGGNDALIGKVSVFVYIVSLITYPLFVMLALLKFG